MSMTPNSYQMQLIPLIICIFSVGFLAHAVVSRLAGDSEGSVSFPAVLMLLSVAYAVLSYRKLTNSLPNEGN